MSAWTTIRDTTVATLATVAPALATALGGPLAGQAVAVLGQKLLGKPNATHEEVDAAIVGATPDQLLALKKEDHDFAEKMKAAGVDLRRIAAQDRDSARKSNAASVAPHVLTGLLLVVFGAEAWAVIGGYAVGIKDTTTAAIGGGIITQTLHYVHQTWTYWFGSDDESA